MLAFLRRTVRGAWHLVLVAWATVLGLGLGLGSAWWVLERDYPFGERRAQAWTAWPTIGAPDVDPYARAIIARTGDVPLALGEGIAFHADADELGRALRGECTYAVTGSTPAARLWTLTVYDGRGRLVDAPQALYGITSAQALRGEDGSVTVTLSPTAQPGNWLQTPENGRITVVLRLYDTPIAGAIGWLEDGAMPRVVRLGCGRATS